MSLDLPILLITTVKTEIAYGFTVHLGDHRPRNTTLRYGRILGRRRDATTGATNGYEYVMYSIGGSYDIGMFTIDLNWTEAVNSADAVANQELSEAVVLSISSSW